MVDFGWLITYGDIIIQVHDGQGQKHRGNAANTSQY